MAEQLSPRAEAEAIEQLGDDIARLMKTFSWRCERMSYEARERIISIPHLDHLDTIAEAFRSLGDAMSRECDERAEADDLRRGNLFEPDYRRFGPR